MSDLASLRVIRMALDLTERQRIEIVELRAELWRVREENRALRVGNRVLGIDARATWGYERNVTKDRLPA